MSESIAIEIWENQTHHKGGWCADEDHPWTYKNFEDCKPPDEVELPSIDWCWVTNWRIDKKPGMTDEEGWEYASRSSRFRSTNRKPKTDKLWNDRARRRLWSRLMRRETAINRNPEVALPKIQHGLSSIHMARIRIEEILQQAPEAANTEQMQKLVQSVKNNIIEITNALDTIEKQHQPQQSGGSGASGAAGNNRGATPNANSASQLAIIKKLRNDLTKEEIAIEKALYPNSDKSKAFPPLRKVTSMRLESGGGGSFGGGGAAATPNNNNSNPFGNSSGTPTINPNTGGPMLNRYASASNLTRNTNTNNISPNNVETPSTPATPRSIVTGGSAKHFNPSVISKAKTGKFQSFTGDDMNAEEGVFVDRTMQERLIEQKLRPVDEATVMQEIIDERSEEIKKVHKGLVEVQDMFNDLSRIVKEQQVEIDNIFKNVDESHAKTKEAFAHIVQANKLQQQGNCIIS